MLAQLTLFLFVSAYVGTTDLDLTAAKGTFTVKWFNPREGGPLRSATPASLHGGAQITLTAPDQEDWLAVVGKL